MAQNEKTKIRLTSIDITALAAELKERLQGLRVNNIYDLNQKTYLLKLSKLDKKEFLIIENGLRFHTTSIKMEKNKMPSSFCMKFRKFLRSKRIEDVRQIGVERVVIITFGSGELQNHIILEFYSQGNIILTDRDFKILALIRSHIFTDTVKQNLKDLMIRTAVGEKYPFELAANLFIEKFDYDKEKILGYINQVQFDKEEDEQEIENGKTAKGKQKSLQLQHFIPFLDQKPKDKKLKEIIFKIVPSLHQPIIDDIVKNNGFNPNLKISVNDVELVQNISIKCLEFIKNFQKSKHKGYLIISDKKEQLKQKLPEISNEETKTEVFNEDVKSEPPKEIYFEFTPCLLTIHENKKFKEFPTFNDCLDVFFQNQVQKKDEKFDKEQMIWKKYNNIKQDQEKRLDKLRSEQEQFIFCANLIEKNLELVDAILNIIKQMKQGGISWDKIQKMINEGKKSGDPLANLIHDMNFEKNQITVLLEDPDIEDTEEMVSVNLDIYETAFMNAKMYYDNKKKNAVKEQKNIQAQKKALQQAEKTALKELETVFYNIIYNQKIKVQSNVVNTRKTYWFEKFYWFITSENFLVISGRDAQQNEIIVKKYMSKGDVYVHADFHGAASTIIKNNNKDQPVPLLTIEEAAVSSICRSKAWDVKIVASAWWVFDHQVSKSAESGEYLPTGSFMIRGKKNFLHPNRLEMGATMLFRIDPEYQNKHFNDRKTKIYSQEEFNLKQQKEQKMIQVEQSEQSVTVLDLTNKEEMAKKEQIRLKQQQQQQLKKQQEKDKQQQGKNQTEKEKQKEKEKNKGKNKKNKKNDEPEYEEKQQEPEIPAQISTMKKNKIKKMQEKYANQDEEERKLRLQILGTKEIKGYQWKGNLLNILNIKDENFKKQSKQNSQQIEQNKEINETPLKDYQDIKIDLQQQQQENQQQVQQQADNTNDKNQLNLITEKQIIDKENENKDVNQEEEVKDVNYENSDNDDVEEEKAQQDTQNQKFDEDETVIKSELQEISNLITNLYPDGILKLYHFVLLMVAPYQTIQNMKCKYKVKLVPGTLKKGKACKQVINYFLTSEKDISNQEKKLFRNLTDNELINTMIGNVKIQGAGVQKIQQDAKNQKRNEKKAKND